MGTRRSRPHAIRCFQTLWSTVVVAAAGCGGGAKEGSDAAAEKTAPAYEKEYASGPVTLVLRLDRTEAKLSERVVLEQELRIEAGFVAEFPEFLPEDFDGFDVVRIDPPGLHLDSDDPDELSEASGDGTTDTERGALRSYQKRLTLEPQRSGELTIAPLYCYFRRRGEQEEKQIVTDEISVQVEGIRGDEIPDLRERYGILTKNPGEGRRDRLWVAIGGVSILTVTAVLYWFVTSRRRRPSPPVPPHEIAWEALRRLVAQDFPARGEIELFFVHLSAILRQYIENRFDVHAPERTTEEFLEEAARSPALARRRTGLAEFLRLSDQVKFARFQPETATIQSSFDAVKRFIEETTTDAS